MGVILSQVLFKVFARNYEIMVIPPGMIICSIYIKCMFHCCFCAFCQTESAVISIHVIMINFQWQLNLICVFQIIPIIKASVI